MSDLKGILLGIGNPLLDISANVDQAFLDKYELKRANAILAEEKHLGISEELKKNYKVEYTAGGAAQNSIRGASWMLKNHPGSVGYIGCVGNDQDGKEMKAAAESYGVTTHYLIDEATHTGTCAVLITDKERSMVAFLGAAEKHKKEHLDTPEVQAAMNQAKYFYMTGFFLTHSPDTLVAIGQHAVQNDKTVLMNLSAPFLIDFFWEQMSRILPYADVIFCNEVEAATLGKKMDWGENLDEIAKKLVGFPKENSKRPRTVIFTQGAKQTIVVTADKDEKYEPIKCSAEELVDTNGAGDAFVAGFLSMYVQQKPLATCVKAGHYAAWECIRRSGATFPPTPNFQE